MRTFKLVMAWILTVLAVLGLVLVVVGFVGSWNVRNRVTTATVALLTAGETAVSVGSDGVTRVDERLGESAGRVMAVESAVVGAGEVLKDNSLIGTAISVTIGEQLAPALNTAKETAVTIAGLTFAINDTINAINDIPFVNLDGPGVTLMQEAADGIVQLNDDVATLKNELVERREGRIEGGVDTLTTYTTVMTQGIQDVQSNLQAFNAELAALSAEMAALKVSLPRTFTLITIGVNLLLLLIAIALVSLLLHGISFIKNPDQTFNDMIGAAPVDTLKA
jgi:hypothetical protein